MPRRLLKRWKKKRKWVEGRRRGHNALVYFSFFTVLGPRRWREMPGRNIRDGCKRTIPKRWGPPQPMAARRARQLKHRKIAREWLAIEDYWRGRSFLDPSGAFRIMPSIVPIPGARTAMGEARCSSVAGNGGESPNTSGVRQKKTEGVPERPEILLHAPQKCIRGGDSQTMPHGDVRVVSYKRVSLFGSETTTRKHGSYSFVPRFHA